MQLLNRLVDLYTIPCVDNDIEGDLDAIFLSSSFNHSKMSDVQNSEVDVIRLTSPLSFAQQWVGYLR
jgi:hypothetical protein